MAPQTPIAAAEPRLLPRRGTHPQQLTAALSMGVLYLFYYFCKYNLGVATPLIQREFGFSSQSFGTVVTVFTLVYALGQFINGHLGDRLGPKAVVVTGGFGGVAANTLFGLSPHFTADAAVLLNLFVLFWAINGYFSSMGWSPGCRIMFNWFPEDRWGQWIGIYNALCYLGGAIVVAVAGYAVDAWGWPAAFLLSPAFLLAMTVAFVFLGRNAPADAGFTPEWETAVPAAPRREIRFADYVRTFVHPRMNLAYLSGMGGNFIRWGLMSWMVKILSDPPSEGGLGMSLVLAAWCASLMHWGGAFFSIVVGVVSDRVFGGTRWQTICASYLVGAAALAVIALGPSVPVVGIAAALFVAGGLIQAVQTPLFSLAGDIMGKELGATGVGIMDGWMYAGASLAGVGLGWVFDTYSLAAGVLLMVGVAVTCGLVAILIRK
jgi:sugar phosphate permease